MLLGSILSVLAHSLPIYVLGDNIPMSSTQLQGILFSQGFGARVCARLVQLSYVAVAGAPCSDLVAELDTVEGLRFTVQGADWDPTKKPI